MIPIGTVLLESDKEYFLVNEKMETVFNEMWLSVLYSQPPFLKVPENITAGSHEEGF